MQHRQDVLIKIIHMENQLHKQRRYIPKQETGIAFIPSLSPQVKTERKILPSKNETAQKFFQQTQQMPSIFFKETQSNRFKSLKPNFNQKQFDFNRIATYSRQEDNKSYNNQIKQDYINPKKFYKPQNSHIQNNFDIIKGIASRYSVNSRNEINIQFKLTTSTNKQKIIPNQFTFTLENFNQRNKTQKVIQTKNDIFKAKIPKIEDSPEWLKDGGPEVGKKMLHYPNPELATYEIQKENLKLERQVKEIDKQLNVLHKIIDDKDEKKSANPFPLAQRRSSEFQESLEQMKIDSFLQENQEIDHDLQFYLEKANKFDCI